MTYNALNNTINFARPQHRNADVNSFDSQVNCDEMSFDKFTPEERAEFEAIQDEMSKEELETVRGEEEFWDNLLLGT
jgi:hypothetical protein